MKYDTQMRPRELGWAALCKPSRGDRVRKLFFVAVALLLSTDFGSAQDTARAVRVQVTNNAADEIELTWRNKGDSSGVGHATLPRGSSRSVELLARRGDLDVTLKWTATARAVRNAHCEVVTTTRAESAKPTIDTPTAHATRSQCSDLTASKCYTLKRSVSGSESPNIILTPTSGTTSCPF